MLRSSLAQSSQQFAGGALFMDLHHDRMCAFVGFADQEVNVFGHDHVAD